MKFFLVALFAIVAVSCADNFSDERFFEFYVSFFRLSMEEGEEKAYSRIDSLISYHNISSEEFADFRGEMVKYPEKWYKFLESFKKWTGERIAFIDSLDAAKAKENTKVIIVGSEEELDRKAKDAYNKNRYLREYIQKRKRENDNYSGYRLEEQKSREIKARQKRGQNRIFR